MVGLPGKSAGLEIAARLGMPEDILRRARASLGTRDLELSQADCGPARKARRNQRLCDELLAKEREALVLREKQIAPEWERKETAKLSELEEPLRRNAAALAGACG